MSALLMDAMLALLAFGVLSGALFFLKRLKAIARFRRALNILFLIASISFFMRPHIEHGYARAIYAALFCTLAYMAVRLLDILLFDVMVQRRGKLPVPVVLRATFRWLLLALGFWN